MDIIRSLQEMQIQFNEEGLSLIALQDMGVVAGVTESSIIDLLSEMSRGNIPRSFSDFYSDQEIRSMAQIALVSRQIQSDYASSFFEYYGMECLIPQSYIAWDYFIHYATNPNYQPKPISQAMKEMPKRAAILNLKKPLGSQATKSKKKPSEGTESRICKRLKKELGALSEVYTPSGYIDLLTEAAVIEVKVADKWKDGIGQLQAYQVYYPTHSKRLHLFGNLGNKLADIKYVCSILNIELTVESFEPS